MNNLFVAWFLSFVSMLGGAYFAFEAGFFQYIYDADASKLCFVILALFMFAYCKLGYLLFNNEKLASEKLDSGYEMADTSMAIGMLGTVVGFIVMSSSFTSVDFSDINNIKDLFRLATNGMSTALYTTAFGLVSNIVLRASHFTVEKLIGRK
jgi:hypothetical protein